MLPNKSWEKHTLFIKIQRIFYEIYFFLTSFYIRCICFTSIHSFKIICSAHYVCCNNNMGECLLKCTEFQPVACAFTVIK